MTAYIDADERDCCYRCEGCGCRTCCDEAPSPGESWGICAGCFMLEDDAAVTA